MLKHWSIKHNISSDALAELVALLETPSAIQPAAVPRSEAAVQNDVRLRASRQGMRLWRNNSGAGQLENGSFVRWGLCNESSQMNKEVKSSDLIGIRPVLITQDMVGTTIGQFVAIECKEASWKPSRNDAHEKAQKKFLDIVTLLGGYGRFVNDATQI